MKTNEKIEEIDEEINQEVNTEIEVYHNLGHDAKDNTFGNRLSDRIAVFGGSWVFIIIFGSFLFIWIFVNIKILIKPYDPYPFILLNLILSTLAAIQAPIIMMSQNRQEKRDRQHIEADYRVNIKAEREIARLNKQLAILIEIQNENSNKIQELSKTLKEKK